ncbi:hypothetical protein RN001_015048 [Aquatica leii]|uniref:DUF4806 domain-containing protein n=1 Tax=Aquatica leii TaxID=1421715 RepID=A0AAN7PP53_9COLE|nr:hypothetical protein RN001_015048 [Aquatica leii]
MSVCRIIIVHNGSRVSTLRYEKAVKNCETPQGTWSLYTVRILGTYSSYEIAKPKLKLAEEQSDLNTSDDEEAKIQRKFKKKVISSSDEEVYEEDHIHSKLKLKPFPPQPQTQNVVQQKRSFNNVNENETIYELNEDDNFNNGNITMVPLQLFDKSAHFKNKMCCDISFIKINLIKLNQRIALVEAGPKQTISKDDVQSREDISIIKSTFPLQNNKDLAEAEAKLQAGLEFKRNLIRYCSSIGGRKVDEIVKLILRKLFSNQLASQYSWLGAKKKRVFSNLILAEVILSSVNANCAAANAKEKDIIDFVLF